MTTNGVYGLPMWFRDVEFTCQCKRCKRYKFDPWVGKCPGVGNGNTLQYCCLENPMDRGAWWATVHGTAECWTRLSSSSSNGA